MSRLVLLCCCVVWCAGLARGYTGSDDRFVKKYAMMKVYESCFGPEVVREIRQEMRLASAKCQERGPAFSPAYGPGFGATFGGPSLDRLDRPQPPPQPPHSPLPPHPPQQSQRPHKPDTTRLAQALMAYLAQGSQGSQGNPLRRRPIYDLVGNGPEAASHGHSHEPVDPVPPPLTTAAAAVSGYSSDSDYTSAAEELADVISRYSGAAPAVPGSVYQVAQQAAPHTTPQVDRLHALHALQVLQQYQQQQQQQQQHLYQPSFSGLRPSLGSRFSRSSRSSKTKAEKEKEKVAKPQPKAQARASGRASGRASRDLDVQGQLETLTTRMTGRVKNVTCVMQELGYLNSALEPDFDRIAARISRLPVSTELRRDMLDGVQFCRQFSQCIPDSRRDKFMLSGELLRPMFFFRCYKHKKLEACIMKDVRERYQQSAQGSVDDNLLPNHRAIDLDREAAGNHPEGLDEDHMAAAVYEFLYGGDNLDSDPFF